MVFAHKLQGDPKNEKKGKLEIPIDHPFPYSGFDSQARIEKSVKESGGLNSNI
jgi:hypothetical protein